MAMPIEVTEVRPLVDYSMNLRCIIILEPRTKAKSEQAICGGGGDGNHAATSSERPAVERYNNGKTPVCSTYDPGEGRSRRNAYLRLDSLLKQSPA